MNEKNSLVDSDSDDDLPPGWERRISENGRIYYACHLLKQTQWTHPITGKRNRIIKELPFGWIKKICSESGKEIYLNTIENTTSFINPRLAYSIEETSDDSIRQRFDGSSTALQVLQGIDLKGKNAVITGASSGIGFETARSLALHGCRVIILGRDFKKCEDAVKSIREENPKAEISIISCDLSFFKSVAKAAQTLIEMQIPIDMLFLNAGVFPAAYSRTTDGFESTFQINYLSHFYLLQLLKPSLSASPRVCRVIIVASESHRFSDINASTVCEAMLSASKSSYRPIIAYNASKMCLVLFGMEVARRWGHSGLRCFVVHPGNVVASQISRHWWLWRVLYALCRPFAKNLQQAAATSVYCATAPELSSSLGGYFISCYQTDPSPAAEDEETAALLWTLSERLLVKGNLKDEFV